MAKVYDEFRVYKAITFSGFQNDLLYITDRFVIWAKLFSNFFSFVQAQDGAEVGKIKFDRNCSCYYEIGP